MIRVYLDLDGVLADFDKRAVEILGARPRDFENTEGEQALWDRLYQEEEFFFNLDPTPDCFELVRGVEMMGFHPTILTGIPRADEGQRSSVTSAYQKKRWVLKHLGPEYECLTVRSKDKRTMMEKKGDVLIDDWHKYMSRWRDWGGHFILHTSAADSLGKLADYTSGLYNLMVEKNFFNSRTHVPGQHA